MSEIETESITVPRFVHEFGRPEPEEFEEFPPERRFYTREPSVLTRRFLGLPGARVTRGAEFTSDILGRFIELYSPRIYSGQGVGLYTPKAFTYVSASFDFDSLKQKRYASTEIRHRSIMGRRGA